MHKVELSLEPRDWHFFIQRFALYDMLQANPKEAASIKKAAKLYYDAMLCIANHTMVSYFVAF